MKQLTGVFRLFPSRGGLSWNVESLGCVLKILSVCVFSLLSLFPSHKGVLVWRVSFLSATAHTGKTFPPLRSVLRGKGTQASVGVEARSELGPSAWNLLPSPSQTFSYHVIIRQGDFSSDRRTMLCKHLFLGCGVLFGLQVLNLPTLFSPLVKVPPRGF